MTKHIARSIAGLTILLFGAMLVGFDSIATAQVTPDQNANSATTKKSNATPQRRPAKPATAKPSSPTAEPSLPAPNVTTEAPATEPVPQTPPKQQTPATEQNTAQMLAAEQTDLSGTYAGTFVCDPAGINGETTLTINGNEFTTADGKSGRIVATTTRGYTAVALQLNDAAGTPAATTTPTILSLRARKNGNRLSLMSIPGATSSCTFTPTATTAKSRRTRGVKQAQPVPAAAGTEVSNPAEAAPTVPDTAGPAPPSQPKSTRGRAKPKPAAPKPSPTPLQP